MQNILSLLTKMHTTCPIKCRINISSIESSNGLIVNLHWEYRINNHTGNYSSNLTNLDLNNQQLIDEFFEKAKRVMAQNIEELRGITDR